MEENPVSLTVVIPAFNAEEWLPKTLHHLADATDRAPGLRVDVIIVDDGSTDQTSTSLDDFDRLDVSFIRTENQGRFLARRTGLREAKGQYVLLLDSRVFLNPDSLTFIAHRLKSDDNQVWTAHVEAATEGNPIGRFWRAIEHVFWRRYFNNPQTLSFDLDDFDFYPKGTTALIAPTQALTKAVDSFRPTVSDWKKVNDDTAVIRDLAASFPIRISPEYSCVYNARTDLRSFVKHANHRGSVLIDGYLRRGTRLRWPIIAVLCSTPIFVLYSISSWSFALSAFIIFPILTTFGALLGGARPFDSLVLGTLFWPFSISYLIGLYRGLFLRFRSNRSS